MLTDGLRLLEGTRIRNATIDSGTSFPSSPSIGELFFRTDSDTLYIHDGTTWNVAATAGGGLNSITVTGDVTGTLDGGTDVLTLATVAGSPGTVGSAANSTVVTFNAKGLTTEVTTTPIQIAETQITDGSVLSRNAGNETITGTWSFSNPVSVAAPTTNGHAANKLYVDQLVAGLSWRNSVVIATTADIVLSDEQTIDSEFVVFGTRVLVKNQNTASQNGIYIVGIPWTRATDFDETSPINEVNLAAVFVQTGTVNASTSWTQTSTVTTVGTDAMTFTQFLGAVPQTAGGVEGSVQFRQGGAPNGSVKLTFDDAAEPVLTIGDGLSNSYLVAREADVSSSGAPAFYIQGSNGTAAEASGGRVFLIGGEGTGQQDGGGISITGGASGPSVNGDGGTVEISGGVGTTRNGDVDLRTGFASRLRIAAEGSLFVNGVAGTSGQILQSNGVGSPPTWVNSSSNSLVGTGNVTISGTTTGAYAGVPSAFGSWSTLALTNSASSTNERVIAIQNVAGQFQVRFANDAQSSFTPFITAIRSANVATSITLTGTAINLTGSVALGANNLVTTGTLSGTHSGSGAALTALNASNLSAGTVAVLRLGSSGTRNSTTFLRGDNIWTVPTFSAAAGTLTGATLAANVLEASLTSVGTLSTVTVSGISNLRGTVALGLDQDAGVNTILRRPNSLGNGGALQITSATGSNQGGSLRLDGGSTFNGTGATGGTVIISGGVAQAGGTGGYVQLSTSPSTAANQTNRLRITHQGAWQLNAALDAGTAGQVLTSTGPTTGPTWQAAGTAAAGTLTGSTLAAGVTASSLTSVGTLASLTVSGTVSAGSFSGPGTGLTGTASSLNIGGNAATATTAGTVTTPAQPNIISVGTLSSLAVSGNVTAAEPTTASHLTTKFYVDSLVQGLTWKTAAKAATTANVTLSGTQTIDGVALVATDRVLVKNQSSASENGVYVVAAGAWARSSDMDGNPSVGEVNGAAVYITDGTTQADTTWTQTATVVTMGTDALTFVQLSGAASTNASSLVGTTLAGNVVNSSLTSVGTLTSLDVTGTVTAGSFSGAGTGLTGTASGLSIGGNAATATSATTAGTVTTAAQPNITSVGTLTSLDVTGTVTAGSFSGAGTGLTGTASGLSIGGSAGSATTAGTVTTGAQPNITSVGTLTGLAVSGNITQAHALTTTSAPISGNTGTLDSFAAATYRSASYTVQITQGSTFEVLNLMVVHDGANAFVTEYGRTSTGTFTGVGFNASISLGTLSVTWTGGSGSPVIKSQETYITV